MNKIQKRKDSMSIIKYEKKVFLLNTVLIIIVLGLKIILETSLFPWGLPEVFALGAGICVVGIGKKKCKKKSWWFAGVQVEWGMSLLFLLFSEWFDVKCRQWFLCGLIPIIISSCFVLVHKKQFSYFSVKKVDANRVEKISRLLAYPIALFFVLARRLPDILNKDMIILSDIIGLLLSSILLAFLLYFFVLALLRREEQRH